MFSAAATVFAPDMLRPELRSMDDFIDGLDNFIEPQRLVDLNYFPNATQQAGDRNIEMRNMAPFTIECSLPSRRRTH